MNVGVPDIVLKNDAVIRDSTQPHGVTPVWLGVALLALLGVGKADGLLWAGCCMALGIIVTLLRRPGEPLTLAAVATLQWCQASAGLLRVLLSDSSLQEEYGTSQLEMATILSQFGILVYACGLRMGAGWSVPLLLQNSQAARLDPLRLAKFHFVFALGAGVLEKAANFSSGLSQILLLFGMFKWIPLFLLAAHTREKGDGWGWLCVIVTIEVFISFLGFFSSFRTVFFIMILGLFARGRPLSVKSAVGLAGALVAFVGILLVWTTIKGHFRNFMTQGERSQVIVVSVDQRVEALGYLIQDLSMKDIGDAWIEVLDRIGYVNLFAEVLDYVPRVLPHEGGKLWFGAVTHMVTPRLLFPEKEAISDSARCALYIGRYVAGADEGTSIGIGYVAESYVDFGSIGMMLPIGLLGLLFGLIYRDLVRRWKGVLLLLGLAIASCILINLGIAIETSNIKMVGPAVLLWLMGRFTLSRFGQALSQKFDPLIEVPVEPRLLP
jgi:hypothetical protein